MTAQFPIDRDECFKLNIKHDPKFMDECFTPELLECEGI